MFKSSLVESTNGYGTFVANSQPPANISEFTSEWKLSS